ncbi:unnamed protein product [Meloidogyne enterolobii]|uniref:Uncharacterized protein n=1 Tax=Meloidogyne enterolobii TaxID=390850 RepID=A0ACB0Z8M6_MELEN
MDRTMSEGDAPFSPFSVYLFFQFFRKILRALGKAFHPECFVCPTCQKSLDGIQFTVDSENSAYCLDCFHERFSPRCASCLKVIF